MRLTRSICSGTGRVAMVTSALSRLANDLIFESLRLAFLILEAKRWTGTCGTHNQITAFQYVCQFVRMCQRSKTHAQQRQNGYQALADCLEFHDEPRTVDLFHGGHGLSGFFNLPFF